MQITGSEKPGRSKVITRQKAKQAPGMSKREESENEELPNDELISENTSRRE